MIKEADKFCTNSNWRIRPDGSEKCGGCCCLRTCDATSDTMPALMHFSRALTWVTSWRVERRILWHTAYLYFYIQSRIHGGWREDHRKMVDSRTVRRILCVTVGGCCECHCDSRGLFQVRWNTEALLFQKNKKKNLNRLRTQTSPNTQSLCSETQT